MVLLHKTCVKTLQHKQTLQNKHFNKLILYIYSLVYYSNVIVY